MEPTRQPHIVVTLDDSDGPADVLDALVAGRFASGAQPAARSIELKRVRPDASLLPVGIAATWTVTGSRRRAHVAQGPDWTLHARRWSDHSASVTVIASTVEIADRILDDAISGAEAPPLPEDEAIEVAFWHRDGSDVRTTAREVSIEPWSAIARNYSGRARAALAGLTELRGEAAHGRLLLVHGPPGTGKTTALRALGHAWRAWCRFDVVLDPEALFGNAGYLLRVALGEDERDERRWRVIVLEDCDELIRADAKREAGQSLARLLNLTDGLLGQGLDVLVAITTNEPLAQLHPAIVRPGRCLAEIAVERLSRDEAAAWLDDHALAAGVPAEGLTLAELFARRGELTKVEVTPAPFAAGQYL